MERASTYRTKQFRSDQGRDVPNLTATAGKADTARSLAASDSAYKAIDGSLRNSIPKLRATKLIRNAGTVNGDEIMV